MILKMAFRNIFRHKRRTILTSLMMLGGYTLISFSLALVDGSYGDMIKLFTSQTTGHVQIHNKKFVDSESIYDGINNYKSIAEKLQSNREVVAFTPRLKNGALAFKNDKTFGVEVIGIDWQSEPEVTTTKSRLAKGNWPNSNGENHVLIGAKAAEVLKVNIDDELVLISQGADGSIANDIFIVKGIFIKEEQGVDDYRVYMDIPSAGQFYSTSQVHEIAIKLKSIDHAEKFSRQLKLTDDLIVRPWQQVEADFFRAMEIDKKGNTVTYTIIMIVVALGILNTVLMSILERTREFGVLKAIGTSPGSLAFMIITEAQLIVIISLVIGGILALAVNKYFSIYGISFSEPMTYGGMTIQAMHAKLTARSFVQPALIVMASTFIVSLYPAYKSARISPLDALRES